MDKVPHMQSTAVASAMTQTSSDAMKLRLIEEECRSIILRLSMLDALLRKPPEGNSYLFIYPHI
jgi:hypothetical protein